MSFNEGDKVKVISTEIRHSGYVGRIGEIVNVFDVSSYIRTYSVSLKWDTKDSSMFDSMGVLASFYESELELVDEKREALIELAETLDKARLQANAIHDAEVSSQRGIYGTVALALHRTLEEIMGAGKVATRNATADRVYDSLLDGNTVREALALVAESNGK